jgi:hypothetical protein
VAERGERNVEQCPPYSGGERHDYIDASDGWSQCRRCGHWQPPAQRGSMRAERTGDDDARPRWDGPTPYDQVDDRMLVASGGWTAPPDAQWWVGTVLLDEQDDGTFTVAGAVTDALPPVPTTRGGARYGETGPPMPKPAVHRVTLRAYGDTMNPGAGMMALECSCGEVLLDQGDEPGDLPLIELVRLERMHTEPGWDDDDD